MDTYSKIDEFVNVSLRIRPTLSQDSTESSCLQVISKQPAVLFVLDRSQTYHFDNIFTEEVDQETVYKESVKPLVEYVKQGYSCTVFAYGQTGTGKTYTMGTSSQVTQKRDIGLIPRALEHFFTYSDDETETDISVSFIEIYNEKVFDLLQNNNKPPLSVKGFQVPGVNQKRVLNCHEAKHFLEMGNKNRHTSGTKQNPYSSRSHAVFTIHCKVRNREHETTAKLNLVDLAGCESVKKTGNQGSTFQEGVNINMGLLCIGQVMTALSQNSSFVPYRQSIITTILQDSLNRKNFVSLIACVNGNPDDCNETVQTLEFAQRVKKMKNRPEVNEIVMQYKRDNPALFQPIKTGSTPFKRPALLPQTPYCAKRIRTLPLTAINEQSVTNTVDSPKSLSSISISSMISTDVTQQTLSPVIKKYITAMESSIVDRLETVIKNTLRRPTRSSVLLKENGMYDTENTPVWKKIQSEVSNLVRTEIAQLTTAVRAASSPLEEHHSIDGIRKVLKYDSPVLNESSDRENDQNEINKYNDEVKKKSIFKVPDAPAAKKKLVSSKRTLAISLIETVPRRSVRLSLKRNNNDSLMKDLSLMSENSYVDDKSLNESRYEGRRSSLRLASKRNRLQDNTKDESHQNVEENHNSLEGTDLGATSKINKSVRRNKRRSTRNTEVVKSHIKKTYDLSKKGRSNKLMDRKTELQTKDIVTDTLTYKFSFKDTPAGKRVKKHGTCADSPATAHSKHVLMLLNNGNEKQLEKLHSIGPKTAHQILLFREIKGTLTKISDLMSIPGWHGKKFQTFTEQNFIKDELL